MVVLAAYGAMYPGVPAIECILVDNVSFELPKVC